MLPFISSRSPEHHRRNTIYREDTVRPRISNVIFLFLAALLWHCAAHVLYSPTQRGCRLVRILEALGQHGLDEKKFEKNVGVEYAIRFAFGKNPLHSTHGVDRSIIHKLLEKVDEISVYTKGNLGASSET